MASAQVTAEPTTRQKILFTTSILGSPWHKEFAPYSKTLLREMRTQADVLLVRPVRLIDKLKSSRPEEAWTAEDTFPGLLAIPKFNQFNLKLRERALEQSLAKHNFEPDSIYVTWAFPDAVVASTLAKTRRIPYVVRVHGTDINYLATLSSLNGLIVAALVGARAVICPSEDLRSKVDNLTQGKANSLTMTNPVSLDAQVKTRSGSSPVILYVGNLKASKGVLDLLQAFILLSDKAPDATLHFVGSGLEEARLKALATEHKLTDRVVFHGHLSHIDSKAKIANARILCLPSYSEGLPNVILEGLAAGIEIVATDVGGISEVLSYENGALLEPGCISSISDELLKALTDPSRRTVATNPPVSEAEYASAILNLLG